MGRSPSQFGLGALHLARLDSLSPLRRSDHQVMDSPTETGITVVLTAYNDESSIGQAVDHPGPPRIDRRQQGSRMEQPPKWLNGRARVVLNALL